MPEWLQSWLPVVSIGLAILALTLGEWRAWRTRRSAHELNIVDWKISWPERDYVLFRSDGPDDARDVRLKLTAYHQTVEVTRKRMRRNDTIRVPVPHLAGHWDAWEEKAPAEGERRSGWRIVSLVEYSGRVTWRSPSGKPQVETISGSFVAQAPEQPQVF